jgi:hypothetical protein
MTHCLGLVLNNRRKLVLSMLDCLLILAVRVRNEAVETSTDRNRTSSDRCFVIQPESTASSLPPVYYLDLSEMRLKI